MTGRAKRLIVRPAADRDVSLIAVYLEAREPGLSERFFERLGEMQIAVCERPQSFPVAFGNIRRTRLDPFKVGMFFRVTGDRIVVIAVIDLRRGPAAIRQRLG